MCFWGLGEPDHPRKPTQACGEHANANHQATVTPDKRTVRYATDTTTARGSCHMASRGQLLQHLLVGSETAEWINPLTLTGCCLLWSRLITGASRPLWTQ